MATEVRVKYKDPPEKEKILQQIKDAPTLGDIHKIVSDFFPDWEVGVLDDFCEYYPHLSPNWKTMCDGLGVPLAKIFIARELFFDLDEDNQILYHFSECLTRSGFAVRSMVDYIPCTKCEKIAVPTPPLHLKMKEIGLSVPDDNLPICKKCR